MTYFVAAPPEAEWSLDPEAFAAWLRADWPAAEASAPPPAVGAYTALDFAVEVDGERCVGRLAATLDSVSVEASLPAFARFAVWLRDRGGQPPGLVAFEPSFGAIVPLDADATTDAVVAGLFDG